MKAKLVNKRFVTLLEVLIAMALTVLILSMLIIFYREVVIVGDELDKTKQQEFYLRYTESRLATILPQILAPKHKEFTFFSLSDDGITSPGSQSLIFTFDNGSSLAKEFSNQVIGRLFLDREGNFSLAQWPTPSHWDRPELPPMKKEVLLSGVEALAFEFYVPPEKSRDKSEKADKSSWPTDAAEDWDVRLWTKEHKNLPVLVKVVLKLKEPITDIPQGFLTKKEEKPAVIFIFPLVGAKAHIIYD